MLRQNKRAALGFIFVTILVDVMGIGIIIPVLPRLIETLIGGDLSEASRYGGWLMFSFAIMQFIFGPVLGGLSDHYGRRPVLLISLGALGINYIFHAYAPTIFWLFAGRLLSGIGGASVTTATAYIADISTHEKKSQNFGIVGAAFGLGFILGPVIGGLAAHKWGIRAPFLVSAGFSLLNMVYGFFVLPESLSLRQRRRFHIKRANPFGSFFHMKKFPVISGLLLSYLLLYIAGHAVHSTWNYYTMFKFDWSERMVGYSLGFVGILMAIVQGGLIRIIIPKIGQKNAIYLGLLFQIAGLVLIAFAKNTMMMFLVIIPYALGGIAGPSLQGIISNHVPANQQGELQGALTSLVSITSIIGPLFMTSLFYRFTRTGSEYFFPGAPYIAGAIIMLMGAIVVYKSFSKNFK